jgi:hypothetical protein
VFVMTRLRSISRPDRPCVAPARRVRSTRGVVSRRAVGSTRGVGRLGAITRPVAAVLAVVVGSGLALGLGPGPGPTPAGAAVPIEAQGVALAPTATCGYGDVDITYDASAVEQQIVSFTTAGGQVLQDRTTQAYKPAYQGTEHILASANPAPAPGTVLAVHVVVGASPRSGSTAAEFTVAYRCDGTANQLGGHNQVLWTCFGDAGACPATADEAVAAAAVPGAVPGAAVAPATAYATAAVAAPVSASPTYTG